MQPFSNATEGRSDYTGLRMSLTDTRECGYHDKPYIIHGTPSAPDRGSEFDFKFENINHSPLNPVSSRQF